MKKLTLIFSIVATISCTNDRKIELDTIKPIDREFLLYDNILSELVTSRFYDLYLGDIEDMTRLQVEYGDVQSPDLLSYDTIVRKLRIRMESDTARQRTICLTDKFYRGPWKILLSFDSTYAHKIPTKYKDLMILVSNDTLAMRDTLDNPQDKYKPGDFHNAAFKIGSPKSKDDCQIGLVGFSKAFFNSTRDKAILYYEFHCGEKCGKGELLLVEYIKGSWKIKSIQRVWIA